MTVQVFRLTLFIVIAAAKITLDLSHSLIVADFLLDQVDVHRFAHSPPFAYGASLGQLLQQCLRLLQIFRVKPFSEPVVDLG